jgi:Rrf2 family protein
MKFNTKTRYGLRTMLELTLNAEKEEGTLQKEIAENQDVSVKYLDHIIADLKAAGLIVNAGGKKSGYKLNKPPEKITIYDIYVAFENELLIIDCLHVTGECPKKGTCVLKEYWCDLNQSIKSSMESQNLSELAEKHKNANDPNTFH